MTKQQKEYNNKVKLLQKIYATEGDHSKNPYWRQQWKDFIKYDHDWDWSYFYEMIIYKLEKMKIYLEINCHCVDEQKKEILDSLDQAIKLGKAARETDFTEKAIMWSEQHTYRWVEVYTHDSTCDQDKCLYKTTKVLSSKLDFLDTSEADEWCKANGHKECEDVHYTYCSEWDSEENQQKYLKKLEAARKAEQKAFDTFFLYVSQHMMMWWD